MAARPIDDIRKRRPLRPESRERVNAIEGAVQLEIALGALREVPGQTRELAGIVARLERSLAADAAVSAYADADLHQNFTPA